MKTPMQELRDKCLEEVYRLKDILDVSPTDKIAGYQDALQSVANDIEAQMMEKEKQAIIKACVHGASSLTFTKQQEIECGVDYYKNTYGK